MVKKALFLRDEDNTCELEPLIKRCRQEQFEVEECNQPQDHETLKSLLPSTPAVLFVPAIEENSFALRLGKVLTI